MGTNLEHRFCIREGYKLDPLGRHVSTSIPGCADHAMKSSFFSFAGDVASRVAQTSYQHYVSIFRNGWSVIAIDTGSDTVYTFLDF